MQNKVLQYISGSTWQPITADGTAIGGGGMINPMTTVGDMIVGGVSGTAARMPIGANGTTLQVDNGIPKWVPTKELNFDLINITTSYTLQPTDFTVCANCSTGSIVVLCPTTGIKRGQYFIIKRLDNSVNSITVNGNGNLIDGLPTLSVSNQWDDVSIQWTGTSWIEI